MAAPGISIFAKPAEYWERKRHLFRGSSIIRGDQIAHHLGAKLNPKSGYESDVCIYVKPPGKPHLYDYDLAGDPYIDIVDGEGIIVYLERNPHVPVIVCSKHDYEYLSGILKNRVVLIPQHHCNFERAKRTRLGVKVIGTIGTPAGFSQIPENLEGRLKDRGLEFYKYEGFRDRQDVVDFYKKIDVQIIWRTWTQKLCNPLSTVNAASYGIPTIAYQEPVFDIELKDHYLPAKSLDDLLAQLDWLTGSPARYKSFAEKLVSKAEDYHIDNIGKLYLALDGSSG